MCRIMAIVASLHSIESNMCASSLVDVVVVGRRSHQTKHNIADKPARDLFGALHFAKDSH